MNDLYVFLFDTIAPLTEKDNFFLFEISSFRSCSLPAPLDPEFFPFRLFFSPPIRGVAYFPLAFLEAKTWPGKTICIAFDHMRRTQFFASNIFLGGNGSVKRLKIRSDMRAVISDTFLGAFSPFPQN